MATVYRKAYCDDMIAYFSKMRRNEKGEILGTPSFLSYAEKLGVDVTVLEKWRRAHPEFDRAAEHAVEILRQLLMEASLNGQINVSAAKFILSAEFGMHPALGDKGRGEQADKGLSESDRRLLHNLEERLTRAEVKA